MARPRSLTRTSASARAVMALAGSLDAAWRSRTRSGRWGALVTSLSRGDTLYAESPDRLLKPASTLKLLTTALALDRFGGSHTFATRVYADARPQGGVVRGGLYLRGDGDPTLSLRFSHGESPTDELARRVRAAGLERVRGDVIADESAFLPERIPVGWKNSYRASAYAAPVSALSLNENVLWVETRVVDGRAVVTLEPPVATLTVRSAVRVIDGRGGRVIVSRATAGVAVSGTIGAQSRPRRYSLVMPDPPLFAGGALAASLARAGVALEGTVRTGQTPSGAVHIAEVRSLPLDSIVAYMNRESINHFAELLLRSASRRPDRAASAAGAEEALGEFLARRVGTRTDGLRTRDGSGLSEADTLSARSLVQVLAYADRAPWGPAFRQSLPVAGHSRLLRRRMNATLAQGNLRAKTGSTNTVASLAGYVTARNGERLAFAFIYNGRDRANARRAMDQMGAALAGFSRE